MYELPIGLPADPLPLLAKWLADAREKSATSNPDAMALATIAKDGKPTVRTVLCKQLVGDPGYLIFYTNYESAKTQALDAVPEVAAVFYWDDLGLQARVEGLAVRSPAAESDHYFASRDRSSQIGAWASAQSQAIDSHEHLHEQVREQETRFAGTDPIPRPPFWGGYRIWLSSVELWVRGDARLHDRGLWQRELQTKRHEFLAGPWRSTRLQP